MAKIIIIGFKESSITQDYVSVVSRYHQTEIVTPDDFFLLPNKNDFGFIVGFTLDKELRKEVIDYIDKKQLASPSIIGNYNSIHESVKIGRGTVIADYNCINQNSIIGNHCLISYYCYIAHYVEIDNNCLCMPGTMLMGKTKIGKDCVFNTKSAVLDKLKICNDTTVAAFASITKSTTKPGIYAGSPARFLKKIQKDK